MDWEKQLRNFLQEAERLVVLGVGLREKGDDGVGSRLVDELVDILKPGKGSRLLLLAAEGSPENYTGLTRHFAPSHILIVDAADAGRVPGDIFILAPESIQKEELSTHRLPLSLLVQYLETTLSCRLLLLGIQPQEFAAGSELSPAVKNSLGSLRDLLMGELARF